MKIKRTKIVAASILVGVCGSASAAVSAVVGLNDNGDMRILNTSTGGESIESLVLTFTDDTFFDTTDDAPGTASSGFASSVNAGTPTVVLPSDAATDGAVVANFTFGTFTPGGDLDIDFDLDAFSDIDGTGDASAAVFTVTFTGGVVSVLSPATGPTPAQVSGFDAVYSVPEPSSILLASLGFLSLGLRRKRQS